MSRQMTDWNFMGDNMSEIKGLEWTFDTVICNLRETMNSGFMEKDMKSV